MVPSYLVVTVFLSSVTCTSLIYRRSRPARSATVGDYVKLIGWTMGIVSDRFQYRYIFLARVAVLRRQPGVRRNVEPSARIYATLRRRRPLCRAVAVPDRSTRR